MKTNMIDDLYNLHPLHRKQIEREYPEIFGLYHECANSVNDSPVNPIASFTRDIIHSIGVLIPVLVMSLSLAIIMMHLVK